MPTPKYFDFDPPVRDPDGIAESQSTATAGSVILNGAQADLGTALQWLISDSFGADIAGAQLRIVSASEGVNYTFTGLDQDGNSITEVIAGAAGSPSTDTVQFFSKVTAITTSGQADLIIIGPSNTMTTKSYPTNWRNREPATYQVYEQDGNMTVHIEEYFGPLNAPLSTDGWVELPGPDGTLHATAARFWAVATETSEAQFAVLQN